MDMKMAVNVQSSLFPKEPPRTAGWDIAFAFTPMKGISGDMYDFLSKKMTSWQDWPFCNIFGPWE